MKISKSKKGIGTSVITDVFALLAYFVFFIIVIILIVSTNTKSKAEVDVQSLKADYSLELLNVLRAPVTLEDGRTLMFAEYLGKVADEDECISKVEAGRYPVAEKPEFFDSVMEEIRPYIQKLDSEGACLSVFYPSLQSLHCSKTPYVVGFIKKKTILSPLGPGTGICGTTGQTLMAEVQYPTGQQNIVKAEVYLE